MLIESPCVYTDWPCSINTSNHHLFTPSQSYSAGRDRLIDRSRSGVSTKEATTDDDSFPDDACVAHLDPDIQPTLTTGISGRNKTAAAGSKQTKINMVLWTILKRMPGSEGTKVSCCVWCEFVCRWWVGWAAAACGAGASPHGPQASHLRSPSPNKQPITHMHPVLFILCIMYRCSSARSSSWASGPCPSSPRSVKPVYLYFCLLRPVCGT